MVIRRWRRFFLPSEMVSSSFVRSKKAGNFMKTKVIDALKAQAIGQQIKLCGWVRTRRDSKQGFSFLEVNDGSCMQNIQVLAASDLPNYESEILKIGIGSSIEVDGEIVASPGKEQETEVKAKTVKVHGFADQASYPLQKKGTSFEFLRT